MSNHPCLLLLFPQRKESSFRGHSGERGRQKNQQWGNGLLLKLNLLLPHYKLKLRQTKHTEHMQVSVQCPITHQSIHRASASSEQLEKPARLSKAIKLNYWRPEEQTVYLEYLKEHMPMITSLAYRKKERIFKKISVRMGSRTPIQVKSHHQKLEDKFRTIPKIIAFLEESLRQGDACSEETLSTEQEPVCESVSEVGLQVQVEDLMVQVEPQVVYEHYEPFFEVDYAENYIRVPLFVEEESLFN